MNSTYAGFPRGYYRITTKPRIDAIRYVKARLRDKAQYPREKLAYMSILVLLVAFTPRRAC